MAKSKIQCQICGREFTRITQSHLDLCSPGLNLTEYRRIYGATSPGGLSKSALSAYAGDIAEMVVEAINKDDTLLTDIATRVGQHLFSDEARGKIMGTAMMLLAERSATYRKMLEHLQTLDSEIFRPERIEAGGPGGEPTDTLTLLQMAKYTNKRVRDSEDTLLRLLKSAIDDRKTQGVNVNLQQNFTGAHERIAIPQSFDPKQREALRRLGTRLVRNPKTVRALITKAKQNDDEEVTEVEAVEK